MDKIARMNQSDRSELFGETAAIMAIPEAIIEKDFWVCWILRYLFNASSLSKDIIFKGGTSLSKAFGIIERFSEDIDLILNWKLLGIGKDEPWIDRSKSQQDRFNKVVNEKAQRYIAETFTETLRNELSTFDITDIGVVTDPHDSFVINVTYPRAFEHPYIRPVVRLEIGPLASWVPHEIRMLKPYSADAFPQMFIDPGCRVAVINAERSFWEKATILHQEAHRPTDKKPLLRYSRHYYDLYKMAMHPVRNSALSSQNLFADVVNFKMRFYPCAWAHYESAKPGTLLLLPDDDCRKRLQDDYLAMREMIFGNVPDFSEIMDVLGRLADEING